MEKKLSVGQNTLFNSLGSLVYLACQWLITVLVVKLASYEDAGNLSLSMSITNMFFTLATFGIRDFQVSDYQEKYAASTYVTTRLLTCLCSTCVCCVVVLANRHYTPHQAACIILYMLFRVSEALVDVFQAIEQKAERMDYACVSFLLRGAFLLGVFCFALAVTHNLLIAIAGIALFSLGVVVLFDFQVGRKLTGFKLNFSLRHTLRLLWECAPLMCNSFLTAAIVAIPRSALESIHGSYALGIYSSIASPATIVQSAAMWLYTPALTTFTRYYAEGEKKNYYGLYGKLWLIIAAAIAAVLAGAKLLGKWGLSLLFTEEIVAYEYLLIPVLITTILIACSYFLGALLTITRTLKIIVISNSISTALVLALSTPLIRTFGMEGVNYVIYLAMGVNVLILSTALTIVLHRHFRMTAPPDGT